MTYLTLGEAANLCGKSKPTLSKAIKSGKMSAIGKKDDGSYQLDPVEVLRVFPLETETSKNLQSETSSNPDSLQPETGGNAMEGLLISTIEDLRRRLDDAEKRLDQERDEARKEREAGRVEREKYMLWLEHKPVEKDEPEQSSELQQAPRRRWWQRKKSTEIA